MTTASVGARHDQVEVALFQLVVRREGDELAVDPADADAADRALERQRRDEQRGRDADHRQHVAVVLRSLASTKLWICTSSR